MLVRERIQFYRRKKVSIGNEVSKLKDFFTQHTTHQDYTIIMNTLYDKYHSTKHKQKTSQQNKFRKLRQTDIQDKQTRRQTDKQFIEKTVINLSQKTLTDHETQVLAKGLNFAVTQNQIPKLDIISAIEDTAQKLPQNVSNEFRFKSKLCLEQLSKLNQNLTKIEKSSIGNLRRDKTIKILPADKGNATVVLDTNTYNDKINTLIGEGHYTKLTKDPTQTIENKIRTILFKHKHEFTDLERRLLTPHYSKPPHFYGLPKIHKPNIPLRPIVSSIGAPCEKLSKYLLKIITPLSGNTDTYIKNTMHFLEKLNDVSTINSGDLLVSFDVVSLFTNVPVDKTLVILRTRLENDSDLATRTNLSVGTILELLTVCLKSTYFQLNDAFFQQDFGMAMGGSLSPIMSNIFMEHFEESFVKTHRHTPKVWWRYVDDVFCIWPHGINHLHEFLDHLNSLEPSIKFTIELESDSQLPFLDTLVHRHTNNNTLDITVYRKKTHTNRYLNFNSNHSTTVKSGIIKSLYDRARIICQNPGTFELEKKFIKEVLELNSYPVHFINRHFTKLETQQRNTTTTTPTLSNDTFIINTIPYIRGFSEKLRRIGHKYNIRTVFKTQHTLRSILTHTKPINTIQNTKNVIYKIPCSCGRLYIGQTKRPMQVRATEHKRNIQNHQTRNSTLAEHFWSDGIHDFDFTNMQTITREAHTNRRQIKESAFIFLNSDNCVSTPSVYFDRVWLGTLEEEIGKGNLKRN